MIWGTIVVLVGIVALFGDLGGDSPWHILTKERIDGYFKEQCEAIDKTGFFLQFHNFWSNSVYLAGGILVLWFNDSLPGKYVGAQMCFLAVGSAWFHGTLTGTGQTVDIAGVYVVMLGIASYAFIELVGWFYHEARTWLLLLGTTIIGIVGAMLRSTSFFKYFFNSDYFVPVLALVIIALGCLTFRAFVRKSVVGMGSPGTSGEWRSPMAIALSFGLLALFFKFSDGENNFVLSFRDDDCTKCLYGPDSIIQGHAIWHTLSAVMFVGMFEYFRAMRGRSSSVFPWRRS
jgi:hypothetical protein